MGAGSDAPRELRLLRQLHGWTVVLRHQEPRTYGEYDSVAGLYEYLFGLPLVMGMGSLVAVGSIQLEVSLVTGLVVGGLTVGLLALPGVVLARDLSHQRQETTLKVDGTWVRFGDQRLALAALTGATAAGDGLELMTASGSHVIGANKLSTRARCWVADELMESAEKLRGEVPDALKALRERT